MVYGCKIVVLKLCAIYSGTPCSGAFAEVESLGHIRVSLIITPNFIHNCVTVTSMFTNRQTTNLFFANLNGSLSCSLTEDQKNIVLKIISGKVAIPCKLCQRQLADISSSKNRTEGKLDLTTQ